MRSKATSAHVYTSVRVDFERVERVRTAQQKDWQAEEGFALTYLPFITRAFCDVVHAYPHVNASVEGETLVVHRDINLGIAIDLSFKGLIAPVMVATALAKLAPMVAATTELGVVPVP